MKYVVQHTKQRMEAFRRSIRLIKQLDFPYKDSKVVLDFVDDAIAQWFATLKDQTEDSSPETAHEICRKVIDDVAQFSSVVGLIERSAQPMGAIELHWPLKDLTQKAIDKDASLVISSDWHYSPLTLTPPNLLIRWNVVLVGMPTSESNNFLLTPLAGHELGHNIWLKHSVLAQVKDAILEQVQLHIENFDAASEDYSDRAFDAQMAGERQAEEIFCDIIGLLMFREGYLHAFRYYLATDAADTDFAYPPGRRRAKVLVECATKRGINVPDNFVESFGPEADDHEIDNISINCADKIYDFAVKFVDLEDRKLDSGSAEGVERIYECFKQLVPACKVESLQDIVNAAWRFELDPECQRIVDAQGAERDTSLVSELAYKTCEIFQIEQTLKA